MDAERWQRLSPLLDALLELDPETRERSLASLREEDPQLAEDLAGLLALEEEGDDFLSQPLVAPLPGARPGSTIGPYKLERLLGEGGMGQVWLASRADGLYQRRVALKLLRPGLADPNLRLRFTRERQILARLAHPHIARLLDAKQIHSLYEYRAVLEAGIVRAACERATDEELAGLRAFVERSRDLSDDSEATRLLELDEAFHLTLARYSRNEEFVRALESVNARIHFVRWIDMERGARLSGSRFAFLRGDLVI